MRGGCGCEGAWLRGSMDERRVWLRGAWLRGLWLSAGDSGSSQIRFILFTQLISIS